MVIDENNEIENNEIWLDIPKYAGWYQASDQGRIRSVDRQTWVLHNGKPHLRSYTGRVLSQALLKHGYYIVVLSRDGKMKIRTVHRLVAITFKERIEGHLEVDHIDRNKQNNNAINLRWATRSINANNRDAVINAKRYSIRNLTGKLPFGLCWYDENSKFRIERFLTADEANERALTFDRANLRPAPKRM